MLQTILNNVPPPKCVVIQDSIETRGLNILLSIIKNRLKLQLEQIHLFLLEIDPERIKKIFPNEKITYYNFTSPNTILNNCDFLTLLDKTSLNGVVIIDSLVHVIFEYGVAKTYTALHKLINGERNILQLATVIHEDCLDNSSNVLNYFSRLSTLTMRLISMGNKSPRVDYFYKKPGGKITKEIEEYYYADGIFYTKGIERPDPKVLLANTVNEKLPEELASFKITLNEKDKKLKDNFVLPYLKTADIGSDNSGGNIIYNLDENDDWDEEDPDDDLDI